MNRRGFLFTLASVPLAGAAMKLNELNKIANTFESTARMPVLFVGHGSPMNAIEENEFVTGWRTIGKGIPHPAAILCISAHWETRGTFVTAMAKPRTIHDFGGFPQELFDVQYPAPGSPELASETKESITKTEVGLDDRWGLDHGTWSVIRRLYPAADVPVVQLSLDYDKNAGAHYDLAKELGALRRKGILIIGSGNMVHNLGKIAWEKMKEPEYGYDWAIEANEKMKKFILADDHRSLIHYKSQGKSFDLAIPSPDHYLPLLYALALKEKQEEVTLFNDKAVMGSLTMTSVKIS
jgi:4,5-DOPA dioxygenase extradiol